MIEQINTVKQSMNYYQLYPSVKPVIQTLVTVIKFYGWSRISIITEVEKPFLEVSIRCLFLENNSDHLVSLGCYLCLSGHCSNYVTTKLSQVNSVGWS